ncbi:unnamed protein product [Chrysoparadoxa australica]
MKDSPSTSFDIYTDGTDEASRISALERDIASLRLEISVYAGYYKRNATEVNAEEEKKRGYRQRRRNAPTTLTIEQKLEVANSELEVALREAEDTKKSSEKLIETLRAVLEETDIRITELKKDAYEFKRDIVVGAENMRTGKTMGEKVIRYMEEKLRQRDAMTEKLRLKNATLKGQVQKVENQIRQKDDTGDALHYIDFHQLQIENKQYVSRIEERNEDLLKGKLTTGKTVSALNTHKNELQKLMARSEWLGREIVARTEALARVKEENVTVANQIAAELRVRKKLSQRNADTSVVPNVDDYIHQKAQLYSLKKVLTSWEKKVAIAEMATQKLRSDARKTRTMMALSS